MNEPKRIRPKRLIVEMSDSEHKEIKIRAARKGISVRAWLLGAIMLRIDYEKKADKP